MTRKTKSYTAPPIPTPPRRRAHTRGGKRRESWPTVDASDAPVVLEDDYTPEGDDDDT